MNSDFPSIIREDVFERPNVLCGVVGEASIADD